MGIRSTSCWIASSSAFEHLDGSMKIGAADPVSMVCWTWVVQGTLCRSSATASARGERLSSCGKKWCPVNGPALAGIGLNMRTLWTTDTVFTSSRVFLFLAQCRGT